MNEPEPVPEPVPDEPDGECSICGSACPDVTEYECDDCGELICADSECWGDDDCAACEGQST